MATLGLSFIMEGAAQAIWGAQVHGLDLGIEDIPFDVGGVSISRFDLFASGVSAVLVISLSLLFSRNRIGLQLRAVADDPLAALAVGIRLQTVWVAVWGVSGFVALVAGLLWGARLGVQFSLSMVVLKALPVLIIGGFSSIPGAIVGGLIVGAGEKLAEVFIGPYIGSGIENWVPYALALIFLMVTPAGLFGERSIERV
jgi:branched-chain amino acid transport system permease protein